MSSGDICPAAGETITGVDTLALGRAAVERQAWGTAYAQLTAADAVSPLALADLELLVTAAFLLGRDSGSPTRSPAARC